MTTSLSRPGRRSAAALTGLGMTLSSLALVVGSTTTAHAAPAPTTRDLDLTVTTKALSAGQYQIAASQETNELFVSSAVGRPPVRTGTITKVDPATLAVKAQAQLPIVKHSDGTHRLVSTHGIDVDDSKDTVWVTNTRDNQVSVYERDTLKHVWSSYPANYSVDGSGVGTMEKEIDHPREVAIDETRGRAYVSGANRGGTGEGIIAVYDTSSYKRLADIVIPMRENYPTDGAPSAPVPMSLDVDEATGNVYSNDMRADRVYKISSAGAVTSWDIPNTTGTAAAASGLAIDVDSKELYSANQETGSIDVFNLETGAHKANVKTGNQALAVAVDSVRDLVYVADFNSGSVAVVDGRTHEVIETVQPEGVTAQANHITVHNGSAYMVDKFSRTETQDVAYSVDPATGERATVNTSVNSITRITPAAEVTVAASAPVAGKLAVTGEGWLSKDGTRGSVVAVKIEQADSTDSFSHLAGHTVHPNATIWATLTADADGVIDATVDLPDGTATGALGSTTAFTPGNYGVRLLSGSLLEPAGSDQPRTFKVPFTATEQVPAATTAPSISGKARVGEKLTVEAGVWTPSSAVASFQWLRDGAPIAGATSTSYAVTKADFAKLLSVKVTARSGAVEGTATTKAVKVAAGASKAGKVNLKGKAKVGRTLKVKTSKWAVGTKLSYRWTVNGKAVKGASKAKLKLKKKYAGKKVRVKVTGKRAGYVTVSKKSKTVKVKK